MVLYEMPADANSAIYIEIASIAHKIPSDWHCVEMVSIHLGLRVYDM